MILKQIILVLMLFWGPVDDISRIAKINTTTKEAEKAFIKKDYETAIEKYSYLINTLGVEDDKALLNLGHAYYKSGKVGDAYATYTLATSSKDPRLRSVAWQQLGVLDYQRKDIDKALYHCKEALKANPNNEQARLNFELLKKMEKPEKDQQKQDKQQDQKQENEKQQEQQEQEKQQEQNKQQQSEQKQNEEKQSQQQQQAGEGKQEQQKKQQSSETGKDKKEEPQQGKNSEQQKEQPAEKGKQSGERDKMVVDRDQLERMNLTEEKARMLLDAMRQNEVQYIQQRQHKGSAQPDKSKPDW